MVSYQANVSDGHYNPNNHSNSFQVTSSVPRETACAGARDMTCVFSAAVSDRTNEHFEASLDIETWSELSHAIWD